MLHLSRLWSVFETVADCHTLACKYELRQVGVECVVGEACCLQGFPYSVYMPAVGGLCDAEDFGCLDSIFIVLVKMERIVVHIPSCKPGTVAEFAGKIIVYTRAALHMISWTAVLISFMSFAAR